MSSSADKNATRKVVLTEPRKPKTDKLKRNLPLTWHLSFKYLYLNHETLNCSKSLKRQPDRIQKFPSALFAANLNSSNSKTLTEDYSISIRTDKFVSYCKAMMKIRVPDISCAILRVKMLTDHILTLRFARILHALFWVISKNYECQSFFNLLCL